MSVRFFFLSDSTTFNISPTHITYLAKHQLNIQIEELPFLFCRDRRPQKLAQCGQNKAKMWKKYILLLLILTKVFSKFFGKIGVITLWS